MNQKEALQRLLEEKIKRQTELDLIKKRLIELDDEISSSIKSRRFGTAYQMVKQILSLVLGIIFILLSLFLLFYHDSFLPEREIWNENLIILKFLFVTAGILMTLGFFLLYISRLSAKMRKRNQKISQAQELTQDIIEHYKRYTSDNENEIETLRIISKME